MFTLFIASGTSFGSILRACGFPRLKVTIFTDLLFDLYRFVLKVPQNLPLAGAAPLLCAGITVYSPLRYFGMDKPGMKIGVVGLGGLGHMVRSSRKMYE